jgi:hypothetical protein|tara:strand:- start:28057 stop:28581 length:525 start_codon:yes stop_codon:yes gene_type:complete
MNFFSNRRQSQGEQMLILKRIAQLPCDMTYKGEECVLYYPRTSVNLHNRFRNFITFKINLGSGTKEQKFILPSMDFIKKELIMDASYDVVSTRYRTITSRIRDVRNNETNYHNQKTLITNTNRTTVIPSISDLGKKYHYIISLTDTLFYRTQVYSRLLAIITNTGNLQAIAFLQ